MFTTRNLLVLIGRQAAIAIGSIIVALLASYFLAREITRVSNGVVQNRHLALTLEKRTELLSTVARDAQIVGVSDTVIDNAFIPSDNILEFVTALETIALKNGATQSFHFETPTPSSVTAPFPVSTIGYSNALSLNVLTFAKYLKDFNTFPYFSKITSLTITSGDPAGWSGTSSLSYHAVLYTKAVQ